MLSNRYLSLELNRVRKTEEWVTDAPGLAFIFASGGSGKCSLGGGINSFGPGDVLVLNHAAAPRLSVAAGNEVVFWCFTVQLEHLYPLFANEEICLLQGLHDYFKSIRCYQAATPVAVECHRLLSSAPPQFSLDHRSHLLRVAAAVLSAELVNARPQRFGFVRMEDHVKVVLEKLSFDQILSLSVDELAKLFSCSRRHLNRLFHQHFGFSVGSLRMEMRLLKAAALLRDPDVKVINVAEQCGFNHLGLFNTCFRRRFSMSPGQWRSQPAREKCNGVATADQICPLHTSGLCPWTAPQTNGHDAKPLPVAAASPKSRDTQIADVKPSVPKTDLDAKIRNRLRKYS